MRPLETPSLNTPLQSLPLNVPERFESVREMTSAHRALMRNRKSGGADFKIQLARFLKVGADLGALLDLPGDRETAQGMLDYWTATISLAQTASPPDVAADSTSQSAVAEPAVLKPFDLKKTQEQVNAIESKVAAFTEPHKALARRILIHVVNLNDDGKTVALVPASQETLRSFGPPAEVDQVLAALVEVEALRAEEDEGRRYYTLACESLLRTWDRLRIWWRSRIAFRKAAEFWQQRHRDTTALFDEGALLDEALTYRDLGALEREFADASNRRFTKRAKDKNRNLRYAVAVLGVLITIGAALLLLLIIKYGEAKHATAAEKQAKSTLEKRNQELITAIKQKEKAFEEKDNAHKLAVDAAAKNKENADAYWKLREKLTAWSITLDENFKRLPKRVQQVDFIEENHRRIQDWLAEYTTTSAGATDLPTGTLHIGARIKVNNRPQIGTLCCFVQDAHGKTYFAAPRFLLDGELGDTVMQVDGKDGKETVVGTIHDFNQPRGNDLVSVAFARLDPNTKPVNRAFMSQVKVVKLAGTVTPGMKVMMAGAFSGEAVGNVIRVNDKTGEIITTKMSEPGDAGAPVVNENGELIGMLVIRRGEENTLIPVGPTLKRLGLKLLPP